LQLPKGGTQAQTLLVHEPKQQSSSFPQPPPCPLQAHVPFAHVPSQQSPSTVHRSPPTPQAQYMWVMSERPVQQLLSPSTMVRPGGRQFVAQTLLVATPLQQSVLDAVLCPAAMHAHAPLTH
jgi:hypothetical protein